MTRFIARAFDAWRSQRPASANPEKQLGTDRLATVALLATLLVLPPGIGAMASVCEGDPLFITEECHDPRFDRPIIDVDEQRDDPVPHRYVNGHFEGTDARFSFYFPLGADNYQGRFFQFTHQLLISENAGEPHIRFALDSGAYLVQTNQGGAEAIRTTEGGVVQGLDPTVVGYRVNAAAAKFSRQVAADKFGDHRPYGYISGGSGGAYQTIASMQNTSVWDGGVPYIMGSVVAAPNVFTARIHALRVLRDGETDKLADILDAIEPGGSGDPFATLNPEQREALEEVTGMGFPLRGWFNYRALTVGALRLVGGYVPLLDPDYFTDYWTTPGYLGHDDPYGSIAAARVQTEATIAFVQPLPSGPARLAVPSNWIIGFAETPEVNIVGADVVVTSGAAEGLKLPILQPGAPGTFIVSGDASQLQPGATVTIDNADYLAMQTYHRHQVPDRKRYTRSAAAHPHFPDFPEHFPSMPAWKQFLDAEGEPIYPQRDLLVGLASSYFSAGSVQSGEFHGKMIGLQTMLDIDAFPWQADWYRAQVQEAGNGDRYRLYFIDHADHGIDVAGTPDVASARQTHLVSFRGALEQTILHLAAWVEDGVEPPGETRYTLDEAQVVLPDNAWQRLGIQPVVHLRANGGERAEVRAGESVRLSALVEVPEGAGAIVAVEWDFEGNGQFVPGTLDTIHPGDIRGVVEHAYTKPGTYFAALRVTSHRAGDPQSLHARVHNLGRARVVVEPRD